MIASAKPTYTTKNHKTASTVYLVLPQGVKPPLRGQKSGKWFLNCDYGDKPFICPKCGHAYSSTYKRGEVCMDCATEAVYDAAAVLQAAGIDLGLNNQKHINRFV